MHNLLPIHCVGSLPKWSDSMSSKQGFRKHLSSAMEKPCVYLSCCSAYCCPSDRLALNLPVVLILMMWRFWSQTPEYQGVGVRTSVPFTWNSTNVWLLCIICCGEDLDCAWLTMGGVDRIVAVRPKARSRAVVSPTIGSRSGRWSEEACGAGWREKCYIPLVSQSDISNTRQNLSASQAKN